MTNNFSYFSANTSPMGVEVVSRVKGILSGIAQAITSRLPRLDSLSIVSRWSVLGIVLVFLTVFGGNAWGAEQYIFEESGGGSVSGWTFTNGTTSNTIDQSSYWLLDAGSTKDYIVTSAYDLSIYETATVYVTIKSYGNGNTYPPLKIEISYNGGSTWSQSYTTSNVTSSNANYNVTLNSTLTSNVKIRLSNNGSSGRGIRVTNFKLKVTYTPVNHTVNWYVNNAETPVRTQTSLQGSNLTNIPTPSKSDCDGKKQFVGWTENASYSNATTAPADLITSTTGMTMPNADKNYYAVFATVSGGVVTITPSCTSKTSTGYESVTWSATSTDGDTYTGSIKVYSTNSNPFQVNSGQTPTFYNDDAFSGPITKIKIIKDSGSDRSWTPRLSSSTKQNSSSASNGTNLTAKTVGTSGTTWDVDVSEDYRYLYLGLTGGATYISSIEITYGSTTNYTTTCCQSLGSINGSVSLSQLATPDPTKLKATWTMNATTGIASYTLEIYDGSTKVKTIENYTSGAEITGLTPCTAYTAKLYAVSQGGDYCEGGLISTSGSCTTTSYSVDYSGCSGVSHSGATSTCASAALSVTFSAASAAYVLPDNVLVKIGGNTATAGTDYTWTKNTGVLSIPANKQTGNIVIDVDGVLVGCSADPTVTNEELGLNGEGTFSLSQVDVTTSGWSTGSNTCEWSDYGFVWGTSENPTVGGEGCEKEQVGNSGSATSWNGSLTGTFTAGVTYHYRAYAKNSKTGAEYVYSSTEGTFKPYTVSYNANGGTGEVATVVVNAGGSVTLPSASAYTLGCNDLTKWALNSADSETKLDPEATYSNINANAEFYAIWNTRTYTISYAAGNTPLVGAEISGSRDNETKTCGVSFTLPNVIFTVTGYTQKGWKKTIDGTSKTNNLNGTYNPSEANEKDQTFYPYWEINTYNVTKGTATGCSGDGFTVASTATHGSSISVTATADAAHKGSAQVSVSPAANATVSGTTISNIIGDIEVSVSFAAKETATIILHDAGGQSTVSGTHYEMDNYTLPNTAASCTESEFYGWYTEAYVDQASAPTGSKYIAKNGSKALVAGDNHFYAVYATIEDRYTNNYTKITSVDDLTTGDYLIVGAYIGSYWYAMENTGTGIEDESVGGTPNSYSTENANIIFTLTKNGSNVTILSQRSPNKYVAINNNAFALQDASQNFTYSVSNGAWTFTSPSEKQIIYSSNFGVGASQNKAIYLYQRTKSPQAGAPYTTSPSCTTHDLDVVVTPNGYGTAEAAKTTIVVGRSTTVTATRAIGYEFAYWTIEGEETSMSNTDGEGKSTDNPVTVTMGTEDATITAHFIEKPKYTITLNAGNGIISASGWTAGDAPVWTKTQANGDESITMPTSECNCSGWEFVGWKQGSEVDNASNFTADKNANDAFVPTESLTYYAVYRQSAPSGTTYNKIISTDDLTTGNYLFISTYPAAMQNTISNNHTGEVTSSINSSNASNTTSNTAIIWTIVKIGDYYAINNGSKFLGTDADGNISLSTTPHLFTATYNTTNSRWEFTSATYTSKQLIYNSYFKIGESQSSAIYLYKQGKTQSGNYYTTPSCTSYDVTGAASPAAGGSVQLTASTAVAGDKVWAYCAPTSGYKFKNWEVSGTGAALSSATAQLTQVTVGSADVELTANVGLLYSITLTSGGELANGTIEADLSSACAGETVTLTATPNEHFTFSSWSVTKTGEPGTTVTVTDNQFTMPAYAVTVNAVFAEAPFRTVVFKNNNVALFDDGDDAELYDATNKWKQKVYVGDEPVWPTSLTSSEKIDANSNIFYGWTATTWEGKVASKSTIDAKTGAEKVYTDDFTGATVEAGEDEVVYYAVWSKETEGNNFELVTDGSKLKAGDAYLGSYISYSGTRYYGATSNNAMQSITVSGTPQTLSSTTGLKKVTFVATSTSGQFQIKDGTKYLYANGAGSAPTWSDNACAWTFSNKDANNLFQVVSSLGTYYLRAYATSTTVGALKMYGNTTNNGICVFQKGTSYGDFITTCHTISGASTSGTAVEYDGDESTITSSHNQAIQGTQITLTVPTASHYTFSSWIVKDESNNDVTVTSNKFTMPASDVTVTATWTPKPYSLTVSEPTNGSIAFEGANEQYTAQNVNYHATVTLTATPADEDYYFAGWTISPSIDGVLTTSPELSFSMPGVTTTISASFAKVVYPSLTLNEDNLSGSSALSATLANGTAIADMSSIKAGTELKVTYTPDGQKELTGWTLTKEGGGDVEYVEDGNTITFNMPNANLTVAANGEQSYYTLDLAATNGSISVVEINEIVQAVASSYRVHENDAVEVTAVPTDNTYKFKEWQKTNIDAENWLSDGAYAYFTVGTSNMTLSAVFEPKAMYNVTLKAMDKTQEVIANKLEGTSIWSIVRYKTAPNLTDYAFQGWCTDVNNASTTMITELADATLGTNITLHAVYSKKAVYRKVTSDAGLGDGDYLIVYEGGDKAFNGGLTTLDATFNTIDVEISDDYTIASNETTDAAKFTLKEITGGYSIKSASNLYIDRSTNSNGLDQGENEVANSVSINGSENVVIYGSFGSTGRNLSFNTALDQQRFRYMGNTSNIQLYKKEAAGAATPTPTDVVADEEELEILVNKTLGNLVVENGGSVTVASGKTLTVNDLTIESMTGKSGQLTGSGSVTVNGNIYMDVKFYSSQNGTTLNETEASQWYMISAPFDVNLADGFINPVSGETMHRGNDDNVNTFDLFEYDGEKRATTGTTGWKRVSGKMTAGTACLIGFNPGQPTTIRLKAASNTISNPTSITLASNESSVGETEEIRTANSNWNGVANPTFHYTDLNTDAYIWNNEEDNGENQGRKYTAYSAGSCTFVVGTPLFIQGNTSANLTTATNNQFRAPKREVNERIEYCVRITHEGANGFADQMYVRASEEATNVYELNHDLIAWNGTSGKSALLWSENYGMRLAIEEAPLANYKATYTLGIFAPNAGEYVISTPTEDEDATLYLTLNGHIIWNLSLGDYTADLQQGLNEGYGLKIVAAPKVSTGVEQPTSDSSLKGRATKVIIDEHVFILHDGQMYDVTGKMVK